MKTAAITFGLVMVGLGAIAPSAIASDPTPAAISMTDLDLPALTTAVQASPDRDAPKIAEVLPPGGFADVSPTHWAYGAVNSLSENYGCIAGYPDGTFRGDQFVTRYEFAAVMDACLGNLLQLVEQERQANVDDILDDLADLESELGTLSGEVEAIESEALPQ